MRNSIFSLFIAMTCLLSMGCGDMLFNPMSPIIGLGIMWYEGEAHKYYRCDQQTLYRAIQTVLNDMEYPIQKIDDRGAKIHIKAGDNDRFKIKVVEVRHNVSKLSIRINFMGDRPYTELIYEQVDKEFGIKVFHSEEELRKALSF